MRLASVGLVVVMAGCGRFGFDHASDGGSDIASIDAHPGCVSAMSAGNEFTCALLSDGTVSCWGSNSNGMLGDGSTADRSIPGPVTGLSSVVAVGVGFEFTCTVRQDRTLWCWGNNTYNQMGTAPASDPQLTPIQVPDLVDVVEVAGGGEHVCARTQAGEVKCWGDNVTGQCGDGTTTSRATPATVSGMPPAIQLSGGGYHTCALAADRTVWCWGSNQFGELGVDTAGALRSSPVQVMGLPPIARIGVNLSQSCAVAMDGSAWCWGDNVTGALGDNTTTNRTTPVRVMGVTEAVDIGTGGFYVPGPGSHTCARDASGTVGCWGWDQYGQLGDGGTVDQHVRVAVAGITDADLLAVGLGHACVRRTGGDLACWGRNLFGTLGNGTTSSYTVPQRVLLTCP